MKLATTAKLPFHLPKRIFFPLQLLKGGNVSFGLTELFQDRVSTGLVSEEDVDVLLELTARPPYSASLSIVFRVLLRVLWSFGPVHVHFAYLAGETSPYREPTLADVYSTLEQMTAGPSQVAHARHCVHHRHAVFTGCKGSDRADRHYVYEPLYSNNYQSVTAGGYDTIVVLLDHHFDSALNRAGLRLSLVTNPSGLIDFTQVTVVGIIGDRVQYVGHVLTVSPMCSLREDKQNDEQPPFVLEPGRNTSTDAVILSLILTGVEETARLYCCIS